MKADIFYFTKKAFVEQPTRFFINAEETEKMLNETGLKNFVQVGSIDCVTTESKESIAEQIFMLYNNPDANPFGSVEGQKKLRDVGAGHTSMSINDFIVINGEILIVDGTGFKNIGRHPAVSEVLKN